MGAGESNKRTHAEGYKLGGYMDNGFTPRILFLLAGLLQARLPRIVPPGLKLMQAWGYKYAQGERAGIGIHADIAVVNINLWVTPDDANEGSVEMGTGGGLVIYKKKAPKEWSFSMYNDLSHEKERAQLLETSAAGFVRVPYKENRIVIFDSKLFHKTDAHQFKDGYENRRINLTLLFTKDPDFAWEEGDALHPEEQEIDRKFPELRLGLHEEENEVNGAVRAGMPPRPLVR